ncbi:hypothetical protein RUE5091_02439 [Ruegeria denitrificans]|uniref:Flagellar FliJ protein n=1 Tax=Ruegeria denitrificans TaxID=1715692 RepID=A0A0P1IBD2_9RHOB|nr:hypothetical protein [Ruegeria denitrificans]CUK02995.1 hypothetical protein RUE5091_02439 [Ruegeria denitrificans]
MKHAGLSDLKKITEAVFQKEYNALRPLLETEAHVQQQLARLDAQVLQSRHDSASAEGYCVTGTDVLWSGWESATRRQLNMELARIRAQKLSAMDALRAAFGRKQAVTNLSAAQKEAHKRAQRKKTSSF